MRFKEIELHKNKRQSPAISPCAFYTGLNEALRRRVLERGDANLPESAKILNSKYWPENPGLTFGEDEIRNLAQKLRLNERE